MDTKKENEFLIKAIHKRNPIWDKKHRQHSSQVIVRKLWQEIADETDLTVEAAKKRWKNFRDLFRIELRKNPQYVRGSSIEECNLKSKWYYFKMLLFLRDHIYKKSEFSSNRKKRRKRKISYSSDDETIENSIKEENDDLFLNESVEIDEIEQLNVPSVSEESWKEFEEITSSPVRRYSGKDQGDIDQITKIRKYISSRNESEAFLESLIPHMGKMRPEQKLLCRIELQKIVYRFAYKTNS